MLFQFLIGWARRQDRQAFPPPSFFAINDHWLLLALLVEAMKEIPSRSRSGDSFIAASRYITPYSLA
nr:hypothetical protein Q903MT_gene5899 [Picea sitchensis]